MDNFLEEEIRDRLENTYIDCPECESIEDDQYQCTTCWCSGGNGRLSVIKAIKFLGYIKNKKRIS